MCMSLKETYISFKNNVLAIQQEHWKGLLSSVIKHICKKRGPHFRTSLHFAHVIRDYYDPRLDRLTLVYFMEETHISTESKHSGPWSLRNNPIKNLQAITTHRPPAPTIPELSHL